MSPYEIFLELNLNNDGIRHHANISNSFLDEWLLNTKERMILKNINCITMDYISPVIVTHLIELNKSLNWFFNFKIIFIKIKKGIHIREIIFFYDTSNHKINAKQSYQYSITKTWIFLILWQFNFYPRIHYILCTKAVE